MPIGTLQRYNVIGNIHSRYLLCTHLANMNKENKITGRCH